MSTLDQATAGIAASEARRRSRTAIRQPLSFDYYTFDGHKQGSGYGVSVNMSEGGILFETERMLDVMSSVLVEIVNPMYTFMATGHIVHTHQKDDKLHQVGVTFHDVIQGGWELVVAIPRLGSGD